MFDYLKTVCGDLHVTRGDFDNAGSRFPEEKVRAEAAHLPGACDALLAACAQLLWAPRLEAGGAGAHPGRLQSRALPRAPGALLHSAASVACGL